MLLLIEGRKTGWGGKREPKPKKQFPVRKEVRLALGHQRAHGQVCTGRKVVISTIVRKWDCGMGPPALWSLPSVEKGRGGWESRATGKDGRRGRRCRLLFRPEVGVCPAAFCAGF